MEIRQLRTFCAIAELGSLTKAAARIHVAQSALSRQVKLLEHELRTELFVRDGRGMLLTEAGEHLYRRMRNVIREVEQARDDLLSMRGMMSGSVVLGLVSTISTAIAIHLTRRITALMPNVSLRVIESYDAHLIDCLHRDRMDLAIIQGPAEELHVETKPLFRDDLLLIGPPGLGLADRAEITFKILVHYPLLLPSHSYTLRSRLERASTQEGVPLNVVLEADSSRMLIGMVRQGMGYTVMPRSAVRQEVLDGTLEAVPVSKPRLSRELLLATAVGRQTSLAADAVGKLIVSEAILAAEQVDCGCPTLSRARD